MADTANGTDGATAPPREIKLAVAMNGGVSLAVWIGGVAFELARACEDDERWKTALGGRTLTVDVLAGTSAGGINAAFLALHHCYGADLSPLREMWLRTAGLEPGPNAPADEKHLLRSPTKGAPSLLDGELFFERLEHAFLTLLKDVTRRNPQVPPPEAVDLRLTTTSLEGEYSPLRDDLDSELHERSHRASFHYVVEDHPGGASSLRFQAGDEALLARRLARASRSTASFPFAFEPSRTDDDFALEGSARPEHNLLDGGVLNNLPLDHAIEAIFSMHASERPERWLVAVVPDPSGPRSPQSKEAAPALADIVMASLMGIPRNQTVRTFVEDVRTQNATVTGRRLARRKLLDLTVSRLDAAADAMYESYKESRRTALAHQLAAKIGAPGHEDVLRILADAPPPHYPPTWPAGEAGWEASVLLRHVSLLLQLHSDAGAPPERRRAIHKIREDASDLSHLEPEERCPNVPWTDALAEELRCWPRRAGAAEREVAAARAQLRHLHEEAAKELLQLAQAPWSAGQHRPQVLTDLCRTGADERVAKARDVLGAMEVLQSTFSTFDDHPEQKVELGFLTPRLPAPLDTSRQRKTAAEKLAGEELGHFGAFLKRSWRANDWMWGRLDASSFLFELIEQHGAPISDDAKEAIQKRIVEEEAPFVCAAVVADNEAGARSPYGTKLLGDAPAERGTFTTWEGVVNAIGLPAGSGGHAAFLERCCIGEEDVGDERWSSLTARLGTRALATTLTVLRGARIPVVQPALNKVLAPLRVVAVVADRYAAALRPRRAEVKDAAWVARLATVALAALGAANLVGVDMGSAAPFIWLALAGLLLTLALVAPLTTALTALLVCGVGLATVVPEHLRPNGWPDWLVPLNRALAIAVITLLLTVISSRRVDRLDRFLRRSIRRGHRTVDALDEATR